MRNFATFVGLLVLVLSALCCTPRPLQVVATSVAVKPRAPDVTTVTIRRELALVLHVDKDFTPAGQAAISHAAARIRELTHGKADLTVAFDVDFDSLENLKGHKDAAHSLVVGVASDFDIVAYIDSNVPGKGTVLAATTDMKDGSKAVFLILDRITDSGADFETVVTHEFGHVIGFPDLEVLGAIMSGVSQRGVAEPLTWTPADLALCKREHYCD